MVQGNGLDLSLFQFDFGLTWAVVFLNADKTIYGRYGSRSSPEAGRDVSLEGFKKAAEGALELHQGYPANKASLSGKTGPAPRFPTPQGYSKLKDYPSTVTPGHKRNNPTCMHCHQIQNGEYRIFRDAKQPIPDRVLWAYSMPDLLGLSFDVDERATVKAVAPNSSAEKDGFKGSDEILALQGQPLLSIADIQWVLEHAKDGDKLNAEVKRGGALKSLSLTLPGGWRRKGNFAWRDATWGAFRPDMAGEDLKPEERKSLKLDSMATGFRLTYVGPGSKGFQKGDIVVGVDGQRSGLASFSQFLAYIAQKKMPGDKIGVTVLRGGREQTLELTAR